MNLGFPGTNSTTVRNHFPTLLRELEPERALLLVGANDIWTVHDPIADEAPDVRVGQRLAWRWSRLYRLLFILGRSVEMPTIDERYTPERPIGFEDRASDVDVGDAQLRFGFQRGEELRSDWAQLLERNLTAIQAIASEAGVGLVLLTYPSELHHYGTSNEVLRRWTRRAGVPLIDLGAAFAPHCPDGVCDLLLVDQHPSARGYAFAAQVVVEALRP